MLPIAVSFVLVFLAGLLVGHRVGVLLQPGPPRCSAEVRPVHATPMWSPQNPVYGDGIVVLEDDDQPLMSPP